MSSGPAVGVVVLAGGTSARLGGGDKTALDVGGMPILARLLAELPPWPTVVVAPPPADGPTLAHVRWTREDPPGSGPAAGLTAGVAALPAGLDVVVVLAGDQPFAAGAVPRLVAALWDEPGADGALGQDTEGRPQPLLAAYRAAALARSLAGVRPGDSIRSALGSLTRVLVPLEREECLDVDDSRDLTSAREIVQRRAARPA